MNATAADPTGPAARPAVAPPGRFATARADQPMPLVFGDVRLDLGQFPDLMPQRLGVAARKLPAATRHSVGLSGCTSSHWSAGDQGPLVLRVPGLAAAFLLRLASGRLRPVVRMLRAGRQRGVLWRLAFALPFQLFDPCPQFRIFRLEFGDLRQQGVDDGVLPAAGEQ